MTETVKEGMRGGNEKTSSSSSWYVFFLAWFAYAGAFFAFSKTAVKPAADITNYQILGLANRYASYVGAALGLASLLAAGIVYLLLRLFRVKSSRLLALVLTALGYVPWLVFGYDLVYLEPRYAEVARAIITYLGKPMLYAAALVCGLSLAGAGLTFVLNKRSK